MTAPTAAEEGRIGQATARLWRSPALLLCAASLFWALNPIVGRAVRDLISPLALSFWRWAIAALVVLVFAWPHLRRDTREIVRSWKVLMLLGLIGIGVFTTVVYWGLHYTTALNNLMMQGAMPPMILALSALLFRERILVSTLAGTAVSLAGMLTIVAQGDFANLLALRFNKGDAAALVAVLLYALYSALLRKKPPIHPLSLLAVLFLVGVATLIGPYLYEVANGRLMVGRPETFLAILYVAIFPSLLSYFFFNRAVDLIGAPRAGIYMNLPPVFGVGLAMLLLGEGIELFHLVGAALVATGVVWTTRAPRPSAP